MTSKKTAKLVEIFSCIQGEGLHIGMRELFVRFGVCDLRCRFCDSSHTWRASKTCKIEQSSGRRDFLEIANPVSSPQLLDLIDNHISGPNKNLHKFLSFTGGEPLLHHSFLQEFLPAFRAKYQIGNNTNDINDVNKKPAIKVYLETAGHLPHRLATVLPWIDSIGMDMKLPSVSGEQHWKAHREFLSLALEAKKEIFVKLIVSKGTFLSDLNHAIDIITDQQRIHTSQPPPPVYLQPVSRLGNVVLPVDELHKLPSKEIELAHLETPPDSTPSPEQVLDWQQLFLSRGVADVRVVPQVHKFINQL